MKYKNLIYLKSGKVLEFEADENLAEQTKDIHDWNGGNIGVWGSNEMVIPRREIEFIETKINEVRE